MSVHKCSLVLFCLFPSRSFSSYLRSHSFTPLIVSSQSHIIPFYCFHAIFHYNHSHHLPLFWHVCIFHFIFLLITLFSFKRTFNSSACAVTPSSRSSCRSSDFCWKKIRGQAKSRLQFLLKMEKENKSWSTFKGLSVLNPEERKRIPFKFKRITFLPWKLNNGQEEENNLPDGLGFANKNCPFSFWIIIILHPCGSLWVV